jgi:PST family polysaccharide transporter
VTNIDKLLLGRIWGTDALGLYGRAFYLINFPGENLNSTIGEVAFAALSRTRSDLDRLRRYFLKGYSLVVTTTLPLAVVFTLFSNDVVSIVLGPKWIGAAEIFRILAPTILAFSILNPLGWLLSSLGLIRRGVFIGLFSAPIMFAAVIVALPYGPRGVAMAYTAVMLIKVVPVTIWVLRGTGILVREVVMALGRPVMASVVAAGVTVAAHEFYAPILPPILRLTFDITAFGAVYLAVLFLIAGKQALYLDLFRSAWTAPSDKGATDSPIA